MRRSLIVWGAKTRLFKLYADNGARVRPESNLNKIFLKRWQHPGG